MINIFLGRRGSDIRKSCRNANNTQQPQQTKVIGSSAALNQTDSNKKSSNKKKTNSKPKNGNETTPANLARQILNNLNIFSKFLPFKIMSFYFNRAEYICV